MAAAAQTQAQAASFRHRNRNRNRNRNRVRVAVYDEESYLIYNFNLNGLFFSGRRRDEDVHQLLPFPRRPAARFQCAVRRESMALATRGAKIFAVTHLSRTIVHDTKSQTTVAGPDMANSKFGPILVAAGGHMLAMSTSYPYYNGPHTEVLRLDDDDRRRPWAWRAVPEPQSPEGEDACFFGSNVMASFVAGGRVWVSVTGPQHGTYSLDMARREWRKEGSWMVPLRERAVYVPELGMLFGFSTEYRHFCACDLEARPPVIRREWHGVRPTLHESCGHYTAFNRADLAYLGHGRFCISRHLVVDRKTVGGFALTAVRVTRRRGLHLRMHKSRCYLMSPQAKCAYLL